MKKIIITLFFIGCLTILLLQNRSSETILVAPVERHIPNHAPFSGYSKIQSHFKMKWLDLGQIPKKRQYMARLYHFLFKPRKVRVIFNNYYLFYSKAKIANLPKGNRALIMWEPPSVLLEMYQKPVFNLFDRIYTWNDELVDGKKFFKFHYPVLKPMQENLPTFEERKLVCMINSNLKFNDYQNELYSKRREIAHFFDERMDVSFGLYGRNWEEFRCAKGTIPNKFETLKEYKFKICFENTKDPGYITEKIFDCFSVGTVPIYLGAPNIEQYIPKECFIDYRQFGSKEEMLSFIQSVSKEQYEAYLSHIRAFLESEAAQLFSQETFENMMIHDLQL